MTAPPLGLTAALADRYRIGRELGRGGMATVYLAHDLRHDRPVALKVLNSDLSALLGAERFSQEIRVTARLRHPHILPLYDSGAAAGALYYVMPLVEGESLRARMDREPPVSVEEAVRLTREVADALAYAHDHGVIHRDIKPENILLENGHALVADFGIARAAAAPGDPRLTRAGLSMGTPLYMSPEQASGEPDFDGRSDLYSLACVLFEMLAGQPPFTGATPEAVLVQRFTRPPPRVSSTRPSVPASVDVALHRALARAPADRYDSMARFASALTGPVVTLSGDEAKSIAVLPFTCMSTEADTEYFGDGMAEEIINALTQLPGLKVAARTSSFSFKGKNEDLRQIGEKLGVSTVLEGSFRRAGKRIRVTAQLIEVASGYHLWSERYDREYADVFAIQDEIATGIADKLKVTLAGASEQLVRPGTANVEAYDLYLKGRAAMRHRGAELWKAIDEFERAISLDPAFALAHAGLAEALTLANFWGLAPSSQLRERAMAAAARALAADPLLPDSHHAIGFTALMIEYDRDKARRSWERAVELDPGNPESLILHAVFHLTYVRRDSPAAERQLRAAIALDPQSSYAYTSLAISLSFSNRSPEALEFADRAVELDPPSFYAQWARLMVTALLGRYDEVLALAPSMSEKFGRHPWILMAISIAAGLAGRLDTAEGVYHEVRGRALLEYVQQPVLAVTALYAGRRDEAIAHLHQAVRERDALMAALALGWPAFAPIRGTPEFDSVLQEMVWLTDAPDS